MGIPRDGIGKYIVGKTESKKSKERPGESIVTVGYNDHGYNKQKMATFWVPNNQSIA